MTHPFTKFDCVTLRHVNLRLDEETWERARQAAEADRRSLTNWITVLVEKAIEDKPGIHEVAAGEP
jgi:hypothetical protein